MEIQRKCSTCSYFYGLGINYCSQFWADTEPDNSCDNHKFDDESEDDKKKYVKISLPLRQGNLDMIVEAVWVELISGDQTAGTGYIRNSPCVCEWVKYGDLVTFENVTPDKPPYKAIATAVINRSE